MSVELTSETGCGGSAQGRATASATSLKLLVPVNDTPADQCVMTFTKSVNGVKLATDGGCYYLAGGSCGFDGVYSRISKPAPVASATSSSWLVGVWIAQGGYCASGDPLKFTAKGGYGNSGGDFEGNWALSGSTLSLVFAEVDPTGGPSGAKQRAKVAAQRISDNEMRLDNVRYKRCSDRGGAEPWHPRETFQTQ